MLAVAVAGMLVYSAAGAAPDDGKDLGPAKASTTSTTSKCEPSTSTTRKDGDKEPTTSTTRKDGDKEPTTSTTRKDGDKEPTTSTTRKDRDEKDDGDAAATKAAAPSGGLDLQGAAVATAAKGADADTDDKATKADADKDCGSTTTTRKGDGGGKDDDEGKDPTTSTTRKRPTTTTTAKGDKDDGKGSTTTTTRQRAVEPHTPNPGSGTGSPDPGSADPGGAPIAPQEAPPFDAPDSDPGPAAEPEAAADPGAVDDSDSFDMWDDEDEYVAISPTETPGSGEPLPVFNQLTSSSSGKVSDRNRRDRSRVTGSRSRESGRSLDDTEELAYAPEEALTARSLTPAAVVESESARRRLGGTRASASREAALPTGAISTPADPLSRRNPLAAAALVLLVGVSRELFKVWRRRAHDFWPA